QRRHVFQPCAHGAHDACAQFTRVYTCTCACHASSLATWKRHKPQPVSIRGENAAGQTLRPAWLCKICGKRVRQRDLVWRHLPTRKVTVCA
ncbi:MAG: hypothetical protein ACOYBU_14125, partial [Dermatophilaceae bacterium]